MTDAPQWFWRALETPYHEATVQVELRDLLKLRLTPVGQFLRALLLHRSCSQYGSPVSCSARTPEGHPSLGEERGNDGSVDGVAPSDVSLNEDFFHATFGRHLDGLTALDGQGEVDHTPGRGSVAEYGVHPFEARDAVREKAGA